MNIGDQIHIVMAHTTMDAVVVSEGPYYLTVRSGTVDERIIHLPWPAIRRIINRTQSEA